MASVRRGRPRTAALRQKSVRVLGDKASVRRGWPRTAALRQKSVRVLGDEASVRRGRPRTAALRQKSVRVSGRGASGRWDAMSSGRGAIERLVLAITHKRDALAVRRPRRNIYRALTAINIRNHARLYVSERHQSNIDVLVKRMVIWVHVFEK